MPATHHTSPPPTTTPETPRSRRAEAGPRTPEKPSAEPGGGVPATTAPLGTAPETGTPAPPTAAPTTSAASASAPSTSARSASGRSTSGPSASGPGTTAPPPKRGGAAPKSGRSVPRAAEAAVPGTGKSAPASGGAAPRAGRSAPKAGRSAVPASRAADVPAGPAAVAATAVGRIPVLDVRPLVQQGRRPAKAVVGEEFEVSATVFREGHDAVAANVVLRGPDGRPGPWTPMRELAPGTDRWGATVRADQEGRWTYTVEAWGDPVTTWRRHAGIKIPAGMDTEPVLEEGALLYERAIAALPKGAKGKGRRDTLLGAVAALRDTARPVASRLAAALTPEVDEVLAGDPLRDLVTSSEPLPLVVERERALYGAWYEFFPRSESGRSKSGRSDPPVHGTFRTAAERLPAIAEMGFDVVY
ncbi:maltotransferase domain-containing protein, partial [Streptomyces sp. NPDC002580]|uniref:maltotransferase domain-containing protein n=1 Tax=Streptomyces sp. NPDC002580 TaxID=3364653 RepID=UPI0036AC886F